MYNLFIDKIINYTKLKGVLLFMSTDLDIIFFCMDFFTSTTRLDKDFPYMKLQLLNTTDDKLRKLGIASYYIKRLQEYCVKEKLSCIKIKPNPKAVDFENQSKNNSLDLESLKNFYTSKSTKDMPIKLI